MVVFADKDVLGLQIPVHNALGLGGREGRGELLGEVHHALKWQLWSRLQDMVKIRALDVGHGDELHISDFTHIVNAKDIGVRNLAGKKQFLLETVQGLHIGHHSLPYNF